LYSFAAVDVYGQRYSGKSLDIILSIYVYHMCRKVNGGLDLKTKSKMKAWILTDGLVGTVPVIGDLIDVSL
jgi:hypothetical protein